MTKDFIMFIQQINNFSDFDNEDQFKIEKLFKKESSNNDLKNFISNELSYLTSNAPIKAKIIDNELKIPVFYANCEFGAFDDRVFLCFDLENGKYILEQNLNIV